MPTAAEEIVDNEQKIAQLQQKNNALKRDIVLGRFPVGKRCRVSIDFDDGHNGARKRHHLLARVSFADAKRVQIQFDHPYRHVPFITVSCVKLFEKYQDLDFFTQQGIAQVIQIVPLARKVVE